MCIRVCYRQSLSRMCLDACRMLCTSLQSLIFRSEYCIWCHKGHGAGPGRAGDTSAQAGAPRRSWHMSLAICRRRKSRPTLWLASVLQGGGDDRPCSCLVVRNCQVVFHDTPAELGKWKCKHNFHVMLHKSRRCWVSPCKERTRSTLWAAPRRPALPRSSHPQQTPQPTGVGQEERKKRREKNAPKTPKSRNPSQCDRRLLFTKQAWLGLPCCTTY